MFNTYIEAISKKRVTSKIAKITDNEYNKIIELLCSNFGQNITSL
jgi:hypothetical protein